MVTTRTVKAKRSLRREEKKPGTLFPFFFSTNSKASHFFLFFSPPPCFCALSLSLSLLSLFQEGPPIQITSRLSRSLQDNACRGRLLIQRAGLLLPREHGKQGLLQVVGTSSISSLVINADCCSRLAGVEGARFGAPRPLCWVRVQIFAF